MGMPFLLCFGGKWSSRCDRIVLRVALCAGNAADVLQSTSRDLLRNEEVLIEQPSRRQWLCEDKPRFSEECRLPL